MAKSKKPSRKRLRQIVGFRMDPELVSEVKAEAGRRSISLRKLFEEMWALYKKNGKVGVGDAS
jgi:hypothetical protein